jgi:hypothetical protein
MVESNRTVGHNIAIRSLFTFLTCSVCSVVVAVASIKIHQSVAMLAYNPVSLKLVRSHGRNAFPEASLRNDAENRLPSI